MKLLVALIGLAVLSSCMSRASWERTAMHASGGFDLGTTWHGMSKGHVEINPIMGQSKVRQAAILTGSLVFQDWLTRWLDRRNQTALASTLRWLTTGTHTAAGIWNLRVVE